MKTRLEGIRTVVDFCDGRYSIRVPHLCGSCGLWPDEEQKIEGRVHALYETAFPVMEKMESYILELKAVLEECLAPSEYSRDGCFYCNGRELNGNAPHEDWCPGGKARALLKAHRGFLEKP